MSDKQVRGKYMQEYKLEASVYSEITLYLTRRKHPLYGLFKWAIQVGGRN
jgi:hypothetical protein